MRRLMSAVVMFDPDVWDTGEDIDEGVWETYV